MKITLRDGLPFISATVHIYSPRLARQEQADELATEMLEEGLDEDNTDELMAKAPSFLASIQQARQQKAAGRVKPLSEIAARYATDEDEDDS